MTASAIEILAAELDARKAQQETLNREYDSLLSLVARIKSGEVALANVEVDQAQRRWAIRPQNADLGKLIGEASQSLSRAGRAAMMAALGHETKEYYDANGHGHGDEGV